MAQLTKKIKISAILELLTGFHIGGSKESVEIGGIDLPVIKLATKGNIPYIPGSSLKGKMRCLLEQANGIQKQGGTGLDGGMIRKLFGYAANSGNAQPSRLIVRDAQMTDESKQMLKESDNLDMPFTENKFENTIDRVKGIAGSPRQIERVPAGVKFKVEFLLNIWEADGDEKKDYPSEQELLEWFWKGINLLAADYLGGSGSRGYGQVAFSDWEAEEIGNPDWSKTTPYVLHH